MALLDANRRFIWVDIGYNRRLSDGGVFTQTNVYKYHEDQQSFKHTCPTTWEVAHTHIIVLLV